MNKVLGFTIIFLFGAYTFYLSLTGGLDFYIHPRYYEFSQFGTIVCMFVGSAGLISTLQHTKLQSLLKDFSRVSTWTPFIVLIVVLAVGFALPPQALSSRSATNRSSANTLVTDQVEQDSIFATFQKNDVNFTIADWIGEFSRNPNFSAYEGRQVDVVGFVYRDESVEEDEFLLGRFVIRCCVVDATPVGLTIDAGDEVYEDNVWLRVQGTFVTQLNDEGGSRLVVVPETIEEVDKPASPYVY